MSPSLGQFVLITTLRGVVETFPPGNGGVFDVLRAQIFPSIFRPPVFDPRNQELSSMGFESSPLFKADRARLTFYPRKTTSCA
jgi:hypothetical protein